MAIQCSYYMEEVETRELPSRFLEAFSTILSHSNCAPFVDAAARMKLRCSRCAVSCPVYQASAERRDIPCDRSELLLKVYRRYFTVGGNLGARIGRPFTLPDEYINRMAEEFYRCTACRRCKLECPLGIDPISRVEKLGRVFLADHERGQIAGGCLGHEAEICKGHA